MFVYGVNRGPPTAVHCDSNQGHIVPRFECEYEDTLIQIRLSILLTLTVNDKPRTMSLIMP